MGEMVAAGWWWQGGGGEGEGGGGEGGGGDGGGDGGGGDGGGGVWDFFSENEGCPTRTKPKRTAGRIAILRGAFHTGTALETTSQGGKTTAGSSMRRIVITFLVALLRCSGRSCDRLHTHAGRARSSSLTSRAHSRKCDHSADRLARS